jgi:hypothetical protein
MTTPKIQSIIENFVAELSAALSEATHSAISDVLGGGKASVAASASTGKGRAPKAAKAPKRAKGGKRSPEELAQLTQALLTHVKRNPGSRIEHIGAALGLPTKELALPAKKLIAEKKLSTKGQKRATAYFAK